MQHGLRKRSRDPSPPRFKSRELQTLSMRRAQDDKPYMGLVKTGRLPYGNRDSDPCFAPQKKQKKSRALRIDETS
jgi:hypothetical protein